MTSKINVITYPRLEKDGSYSVVVLIKNIFSNDKKREIWDNLNSVEMWEKGEIKGNIIRRVQNWYHNEGKSFSSKWKTVFPRWVSKAYPGWLLTLQNQVQTEVDNILKEEGIYQKYGINSVYFNSVLSNKYITGLDSIKAHKDNEEIFGDNPTIVSLTIGRTRKFRMTRVYHDPKCPKSCKSNPEEQSYNLEFDLESGDILVMAGSSQKWYSHEVPKCKDPDDNVQVRYNMTFRNHIG